MRMPEASRCATLKASAPPANEIGTAAPNSSTTRAARFVVTAWSGRPERYIVSSRSKTLRQLSTSSVFDSFSAKARPRAAAARRRLWNMGTASAHFRSCSNAWSGTGTSPKPRSSLTMLRTRSAPSSVGLHLTEVWRPRSSSR